MKFFLTFAAGFLLAVLSALPTWRAADYGLVNCDDYAYLNHANERPLNDLSQGIWMPLTWASYRLDHKIADKCNVREETVLHLHSVIVHGANAVLLFLLLLALCRNVPLALLAAAFWSLHPLRIESVVWIASRKDVLSMFGLLFALLVWVRRPDGRRRLLSNAVALAAFTIGATAKPSVMCFPVLAFLLDFLVLRRKLLWQEYVLPLASALGIAALAAYAQGAGGATESLAAVPLWWKCLNAATSLGIYRYNTLLPLDLAPQCVARWPGLPRHVMTGMLLCGGFLFVGWHLRRRLFSDSRLSWVLAGMAWFLVAIFPMLGILGFGVHAFADRFTYIPAVGFSLMLIALRPRPCHFAWLLPAVAALGLLSTRQCAHWENDGTLWARTLSVDGSGNANAHANLGLYHYEFTHDLDEAIMHFKAAGEGERIIGKTHPYWILALCEQGKREEARVPYETLSAWDGREVDRARATGLNVGSTLGFRVARDVWLWAGDDPDLKKIAREDADKLVRHAPNEVSVKYLRYVLGDIPAKDVTGDPRQTYVCFRFLQK